MPELRKDPIIGRWVIISSERGKRPSDFQWQITKKKGGFCPLCEGNEYTTPPEILAYRKLGTLPNKPGWTLRVVPNKFPALRIEGMLDKTGEGIYDRMNGIGAHEVIIESPIHETTLSTLPLSAVRDVLWAYKERIDDLKKDRRFQYILIFKNEGEAAGASLEHTHSQLIALPIVPKQVREEIDGAIQHYDYKERCIFCDIIRQELETNSRVISENEHFITLSPFAPRSPFETWILPKEHESSYELTGKEKFYALASILQMTLKQLDKVLNTPPYNYMIHTSTFDEPVNDYYHWHIEIMPKLTKIAGFEWGSGFYINPTPPEEAAAFLRETEVVEVFP
ncbi:MAG: galactose-1-phosphate uridylyltransferase [Nitrospirota bacterium]